MPRTPKAGQTALVAVGDLRHFPGNPWHGDIAAIARSLEELDQYKPIVVNLGGKETKGTVLAGNHTLQAARDELGWKKIRVYYVDVDDARARQINVADNRIPQLGAWDEEALADLLDSVVAGGEEALDVTGFDQPTLEGLKLETPEPPPPKEFKVADPDEDCDYRCPGCGYEWSGKPK